MEHALSQGIHWLTRGIEIIGIAVITVGALARWVAYVRSLEGGTIRMSG
jgi:hypothetical protein